MSYAPLSEREHLQQLCIYKVTKTFPQERFTQTLSNKHQQDLERFMEQIEEFVYNPCSEQTLVFQISSPSLQKALSKQVTKVYMSTGIFAQYQRGNPETKIKKSKSFKQANFLRGFAKPDDAKAKIADLGFCTDQTSELTHRVSPV